MCPARALAPDPRHLVGLAATVSPRVPKGGSSVLKKATPERLSAFSDGVFAVLITVLVLDLRPPSQPEFTALLALWPTWLSYAVSYVFIAIVWINHHHVLRYAREATARMLWLNFANLFSISLLPLATAWMATSALAPQPVCFYAAVIFLVNATYVALVWDLIEGRAADAAAVRKAMRRHTNNTQNQNNTTTNNTLRYPYAGLAICIGCLILFLKPDT